VISVEDLITQVTEVYSILRYEFIEKLKQRPIPDSVQDRLHALEEFGEIKIKDGQISKAARNKKQREQLSLVKFFNNLGLHLMDTYLFVNMAVMEICNSNHEIREEQLIHELHQMIIKMHSQNLVTQLHSCLKETIKTALVRYTNMGMLEHKNFSNQNGGVTGYFTSPLSQKQKIDQLLQKQVAYKGLNQEEFANWGEKVDQAIENAMVVFMSVSKL